jgi:hypothetical protein
MLPRLRWKLQSTLAAFAVLAVVLSGFAQIEHARRVERLERQAMMRALPLRRVKKLFGERGVAILREPSAVEVLPEYGTGDVSPIPIPRQETAQRIAPFLLDGAHYFSGDHLTVPRFAFRFWRDRDSLEVRFNADSPDHLDIWTRVHDARGRVIHTAGPSCLEHPALKHLLMECLGATLASVSPPGRVTDVSLERFSVGSRTVWMAGVAVFGNPGLQAPGSEADPSHPERSLCGLSNRKPL